MTVLSTEASESPLPARGGRSANLASAFVGARIIACSSEAAGCEAENLLYESRDLVWRARRGAKAARVALRLSAAGAPRLGFGADFVRSVGWRCAPGHAPVQATVEASSDGDAYRVLLTLTTPDASAGEFHLWDLPSALDLTRERHVRFTLEGDAQLSSLLCCSDNARNAAQALAATATPPQSDNEEDEDAAAARRALDETADELARKIDALRESEKRSRELFAALDRRDARADSSSSTDQDVTRPSSYATSTVASPPRLPVVGGPSPGTARLEAALAGARAARTRAERDCDAAERRRRAEPTFPRAFWDDAQSALVLPDAAGPPPLSALALPDGARDATAPAAAPRRPAADAARDAAPAAFDGAAVEAGLRALADRIDAFAESRERAVPEQNSAAIEALAARVDALARDFEARPRAAGAVDAVASERPPMAPDTGCEPPAPRPAPQLSPAAGREPPRPTAREASPPRATAVAAWSPRSTVPGLRPARAGGADAPPRPLPPPQMPPRAAPVAAPVAASPPRSPPRRAEHAPSPRRAEVATSPLRRAEPPAVEPPSAPQRRGPSVAAVTEALARDSVDDRDAETHLTRCILRAALRRKLRRRDRKAAELKMNEFMRATRRVARGKC